MVVEHFVAYSVEEALAYLASHRGEAQVIAGGTDLLPQIEGGECLATRLVDISRVCTLKRIVPKGDNLVIGGGVTFATLVDNAIMQQNAPLLQEAVRQMVAAQANGSATLAGTLVVARGSAPSSVALVALDAQVEITNLTGRQWLPADSLFVRNGVSRVDSTSEIITAMQFHALKPGQGVALESLTPLAPYAPVPFVLALFVALNADRRTIGWAAVAMGTANGVPAHLREVEKALVGANASDPRAREAFATSVSDQAIGRRALEGAAPTTRRETLVALALRVLERATAMALRNTASAASPATS